MNELKKKGVSAFLWDFFGKVLTQSTGFIISIILARLLIPSDFGLIALIMVFTGVAQVFTDLGLSTSLIQRKKSLPIHYSSAFYFNLFIASLLTILTFISAEYIADFYQEARLTPLLQVTSVLFILNSLSNVQTTILRKDLHYRLITKATIWASVISGMCGVFLAFSGSGVWSLLAQILTQSLIYNIIVWSYSDWRPALQFSTKALKQLWGFGFRMFIAGLIDAVFTRIDYVIIGKIFPMATLGQFQRAKSFDALIIKYTSGSLMSVLFPVLSQLKDSHNEFEKVVFKTLQILSLGIFFMIGIFYLAAEDLIVLLFTEKWLPAADYLKVLILSSYGYPISALLVNIISSKGNSKNFLRLEILKKSLHIPNFFIAYYYGITLYLYTLALITFLSVAINVYYANKEVKSPISHFFSPILTQLFLCSSSVLLTLYISASLEKSSLLTLLELLLFVLLFVSQNALFKTKALQEIITFLAPEIKRLLKRC